MPLTSVGVYGKLAPGDGLAILGGGAVPQELARAVGEWLRVFLATRNRAIVAACRSCDRWWLMRPEWDSLVDAAGRDLGFVVFGALPPTIEPAELPALLLQLARSSISKQAPPCSVTPALLPVQRSETAAAALLTLSLGHVAASVSTLDEATAVLAAAPELPLAWVAFLTDQLPINLPGGAGLIISREALPMPAELLQLVRDHGPETLFGLGLDELPALFGTPNNRLRAVRAMLRNPEAAEVPLEIPAGITAASAAWLARMPGGRAAALAGLPGCEVAAWLASPSVRPEDLPELSDRLDPAHSTAVRRLLVGRRRAAAEYLRYFPNDAAGARDLLEPAIVRLWDQLADETAELPTSIEVAAFLQAISGLEKTLTRAQLARIVALDRSAQGLFLDALDREGLSREIGAALLGTEPVRPSCSAPPALRPASSWLVPFTPERWLAAGAELAGEPAWREWWLEGVRCLRDNNRLSATQIIREGIRRKDAGLLALGGCPGSFLAWVTTDRPVLFPPQDGSWPAEADNLLANALDSGEFFTRLAGPLTEESLAWIASRDPARSEFVQAGQLGWALRGGEPADPQWLARAVGALPRAMLLRQIAAQGQGLGGAERRKALSVLLASGRLGLEEARWLRDLLLDGVPLGSTPAWSAADLLELLPVLDPVRDVVRLVLNRPVREDREGELLTRLLGRLRAAPAPPPGGIPEVARTLRPDWVDALTELPGWEGLAAPDAVIAQMLELARLLPQPTRAAITRILAGEAP